MMPRLVGAHRVVFYKGPSEVWFSGLLFSEISSRPRETLKLFFKNLNL